MPRAPDQDALDGEVVDELAEGGLEPSASVVECLAAMQVRIMGGGAIRRKQHDALGQELLSQGWDKYARSPTTKPVTPSTKSASIVGSASLAGAMHRVAITPECAQRA